MADCVSDSDEEERKKMGFLHCKPLVFVWDSPVDANLDSHVAFLGRCGRVFGSTGREAGHRTMKEMEEKGN